MDSLELRQMSIENAKLALEQAKYNVEVEGLVGIGQLINQKVEWRLTDEQKEGINKMLEFFQSDKWYAYDFEVCVGKFDTVEDEWRMMSGSRISNFLGLYLNEGGYKSGGRSILNGIRECYIEKNK